MCAFCVRWAEVWIQAKELFLATSPRCAPFTSHIQYPLSEGLCQILFTMLIGCILVAQLHQEFSRDEVIMSGKLLNFFAWAVVNGCHHTMSPIILQEHVNRHTSTSRDTLFNLAQGVGRKFHGIGYALW